MNPPPGVPSKQVMSRANPSAYDQTDGYQMSLRENDLYMRGKLNEPAIRSDTREGSHILNPAEGYRLTGKETAAAMHACSSADSLSASPQMKIETQGGWSNAKPQLVTDKDGLNVKFRPASASSVLPGQPPFHASPQFRYSTVGDTTSITASGKESPRYGKQQAQRHSGRKGTVGATVHPPNYYSLANHFSSKKPDGHRYIAASSPAKVADPTTSVAKNTALLPSNATPGYPKQAATVPVWVQPSPTASMTNLDHFIAATSSEIDQTPSGAASATDASGRSSPMKQVLAMDLGPETEEAIRWLQKNKKHVPEEGITGGHRWPGQQIVQLSPRRESSSPSERSLASHSNDGAFVGKAGYDQPRVLVRSPRSTSPAPPPTRSFISPNTTTGRETSPPPSKEWPPSTTTSPQQQAKEWLITQQKPQTTGQHPEQIIPPSFQEQAASGLVEYGRTVLRKDQEEASGSGGLRMDAAMEAHSYVYSSKRPSAHSAKAVLDSRMEADGPLPEGAAAAIYIQKAMNGHAPTSPASLAATGLSIYANPPQPEAGGRFATESEVVYHETTRQQPIWKLGNKAAPLQVRTNSVSPTADQQESSRRGGRSTERQRSVSPPLLSPSGTARDRSPSPPQSPPPQGRIRQCAVNGPSVVCGRICSNASIRPARRFTQIA